MVTSDFRPEVEVWPFRICAMKNMQRLNYNIINYNILLLAQLCHRTVSFLYNTSTELKCLVRIIVMEQKVHLKHFQLSCGSRRHLVD